MTRSVKWWPYNAGTANRWGTSKLNAHATLDHLGSSSVQRERVKRRLKRRFKLSATRIRSSKKSLKNPRPKMRAFRLLTRGSMSCTGQSSGRIVSVRIDLVQKNLCCFLKNQHLSKSEETLNHVNLEGTHVSKTNNKEDCSARLAERPV